MHIVFSLDCMFAIKIYFLLYVLG